MANTIDSKEKRLLSSDCSFCIFITASLLLPLALASFCSDFMRLISNALLSIISLCRSCWNLASSFCCLSCSMLRLADASFISIFFASRRLLPAMSLISLRSASNTAFILLRYSTTSRWNISQASFHSPLCAQSCSARRRYPSSVSSCFALSSASLRLPSNSMLIISSNLSSYGYLKPFSDFIFLISE